jgi:transposase
MPEARVVEWIRGKFDAIVGELDERGRRRWAAAEAVSLGRGGITAVAKASGLSDRTIRNGIREFQGPDPLPLGRQRRPGAGRPAREAQWPGLIPALEELVEPAARGDPMSPLRWTCKSTRTLAAELKRLGFPVSRTKVAELLKEKGYSLQANRKTREGKQHPDRNAQFEHINRRVLACQRRSQPAISVDTKKKEVLGNRKNAGRTYRPKGKPREVDTHDFPDEKLGKAIPYGVYDLANNNAWVSVGIDHDTAEFAVASIAEWWKRMGRKRYPGAKRLLVTGDSGGSNGHRNRLWKAELQRFADRTGLIVEVCHFPPGTSKWNKIEHRLFCHITRNWRGIPLETHEIVVNLIGSTRTTQGLEVHAWLDRRKYAKGRQVSDAEFAAIHIRRNSFQGEWNYEIHPRKKPPFR